MTFQPPGPPPPKINRDGDIPGTTRELMGVYIPGETDPYEGHLQTVIIKKEPHFLNRPAPPTVTVWLLAVAVTLVTFLISFLGLNNGIGTFSPADMLNFGTTPTELAANGGGVTDPATLEEQIELLKEQARTGALILFGVAAAYLTTLGAAITAMVRGNNIIAMLGFAAFILGPPAVLILLPLYL